jgi:hypothetical protein
MGQVDDTMTKTLAAPRSALNAALSSWTVVGEIGEGGWLLVCRVGLRWQRTGCADWRIDVGVSARTHQPAARRVIANPRIAVRLRGRKKPATMAVAGHTIVRPAGRRLSDPQQTLSVVLLSDAKSALAVSLVGRFIGIASSALIQEFACRGRSPLLLSRLY